MTQSKHEPLVPLFRDHYDALWRRAQAMGIHEGDADDVVQEVFIVALRRYEDYEERDRERAWLYAILRNVGANHGRRCARRQRLHGELAVVRDPPMRDELNPRLHGHLCLRLFREFLETLCESKREAFVLHKLGGMSSREIARTLGQSPNTVQSRLRTAERAFKRRFQQDGGRARLLALAGQGQTTLSGRDLRAWLVLVSGLILGALALGSPEPRRGVMAQQPVASERKAHRRSTPPNVIAKQARHLTVLGRPDEALALLESGASTGIPSAYWIGTEVRALCALGRQQEGRARLEQWVSETNVAFYTVADSDPCGDGAANTP